MRDGKSRPFGIAYFRDFCDQAQLRDLSVWQTLSQTT
jgi:hypothetical protein